MKIDDPKHGSTQASWARARDNVNGVRPIAEPVTATLRKTPRHKPSKKGTTRKSAAKKAKTSTAYTGPQLPLPSAMPLATDLLQVLPGHEVPEWLTLELNHIALVRPGAWYLVVRQVGQDGIWIQCCDCETYHKVEQPDSMDGFLEHVKSHDHMRNVNIRYAIQHGTMV